MVPVSKIDNIVIGDGKRGPVTTKVQKAFFDIIKGEVADKFDWFTRV
jgi:branched-chain amino acid aminotransferase